MRLLKNKSTEILYAQNRSLARLDVHDVGSYNTTFKKNMVLTVEPDLYTSSKDIPREFWNIGIRIEDDAIVKEKGCELISRDVPVELNEVEQLQVYKN